MGAGILSLEGAVLAVDSERFSAFVGEHRDRAVGLAWRLLGSEASAAAEDVAQEAFVRAYRSLDRFRGEAALSTWFYRILVNEVNRYLRWRWVRDRFAAGSSEEPTGPTPEDASDPVLRKRVSRALESLPHGQREAFVLVHLEGFTVREAAELSGKATGTIKSHLHRALRSLRTQLAELDPRRKADTA